MVLAPGLQRGHRRGQRVELVGQPSVAQADGTAEVTLSDLIGGFLVVMAVLAFMRLWDWLDGDE